MIVEEPENAKHYALVQNGVITNVVVWDGETPYTPDGELVLIDGLTPEPGIGWDYKKGKFVDNRPIEDNFNETS
jgi:hypothetical protein